MKTSSCSLILNLPSSIRPVEKYCHPHWVSIVSWKSPNTKSPNFPQECRPCTFISPHFPHYMGKYLCQSPHIFPGMPGDPPLPQGSRWHVHKTTKNFILLIKNLIQNSLSSSTWMFTLQVRILKHLKISLSKMWLTVAPVGKITLSNL